MFTLDLLRDCIGALGYLLLWLLIVRALLRGKKWTCVVTSPKALAHAFLLLSAMLGLLLTLILASADDPGRQQNERVQVVK